MATSFTERARADGDLASTGVSRAMRHRIAASLDLGHRPTVTSSGLVRLGNDAGPVLVSADQVERKSGAELRRQLARAPAGSVNTGQFPSTVGCGPAGR